MSPAPIYGTDCRRRFGLCFRHKRPFPVRGLADERGTLCTSSETETKSSVSGVGAQLETYRVQAIEVTVGNLLGDT